MDDYCVKSNIVDDDDYLFPSDEDLTKEQKIEKLLAKIKFYQDIVNDLTMEYYALDNQWFAPDGLD
jgi:hypothetical protein